MSDQLAIDLYGVINKVEREDRSDHWHASELAMCPKAVYLRRKGVKAVNEPSGAMKLRWATGHALEGAVRPYLKELYPNLVSNVRFTNEELDLTGELDNYDPDSKTIIEVKSVHPNAVKYKKKEDTRFHLRDEKPYLHHEYQQHAYVLLMSHPGTYRPEELATYPSGDMSNGLQVTPIKIGEWEVERIIYLYVNLSGLIVTYETEVKPDILQRVENRLQHLNSIWGKEGVTPKCFCADEADPLYKGVLQFCPYRRKDIGECCEEIKDNFKEAVYASGYDKTIVNLGKEKNNG